MPKFIDKDENKLLDLQMSTDEHWTGKYWIDGKKIYEKIITWTGLRVGVSTINHSISNLNEFIDYEVFIQGDNTFYKLPVVYYSNATSGTFYDMFARINETSLQIINNSVGWNKYAVTAIIYYTKNTYHDFD